MNNRRTSVTANRITINSGYFSAAARLKKEQFSLLRSEIEMLAREEMNLMKIAGAAALFISRLEYMTLPGESLGCAATLARLVNEMPEDLMADALQLLEA